MVGTLIAHSDYPPGSDLVTTTLPKPVHFDRDEATWADGASGVSFDVETVALHEIGHILGLRHSADPRAVMFSSIPAGVRRAQLTEDDLAGIGQIYPPSSLVQGTYTVRQQSTGRFLDAHDSASQDFSAVTRERQDDGSQRWVLDPVGVVVTLRQLSTGRFLDAHESGSTDFSAMTREPSPSDTQRWILRPAADGTSTLQQLSTGRFLDAHESSSTHFEVMTRTAQGNSSQRWHVDRAGDRTFTLRQASSGRFAEAHQTSSQDFGVVARDGRNTDAQRWIMGHVGTVHTLRQENTGRYLDAHTNDDFSAVTREGRDRDGQRWALLVHGDGSFTIQQVATARYLDTAGSSSVVTRSARDDACQRWLINPVS